MVVQLIGAVHCLLRWSGRALAAWGAAWLPPTLPATDDGDPRICRSCRRPFACPVEWEEEGDSHWWIALRCGECGHRDEIILDNAATARLEVSLAEDQRMIEDVLLLHGLVAPDDFAPEVR